MPDMHLPISPSPAPQSEIEKEPAPEPEAAPFRNTLAEFVFTRTYSRWLEDEQRRERWDETVDRYVGFISAHRPNIPSQVIKDIRAAILRMEVMPSMRALWSAGPAAERDNTCFYNCFGGEEGFVTTEGVLTFRESVGRAVTVRTADGSWRPAEVRSFGTQKVFDVVLSHYTGGKHGNETHKVRVTANHRWLLLDGSETTSLQVGDKLAAPNMAIEEGGSDFEEGARHGFVFGDGTLTYPNGGAQGYAQVRLCGKKARLQHSLFAGFEHSHPPTYGGDPVVYCGKENAHWKSLPATTNPSYVAGFIHGLFLADGCGTTTSGNLRLSSQDVELVEWVRRHAAIAGYKFLSDRVYTENTNFGERSAPLHMFMLGTGNAAVLRVESIQPAGEEEVFCVTEPVTGTFTLANGQVTGNCSFVPLDSFKAFSEMLYILMMGTGVGYSVESQFVDELPTIAPVSGKTIDYEIPDSTVGWADALYFGMTQWFQGHKVNFDYSNIRPQGAILKTKGGRASGPEPLIRLMEFAEKTVLAAAGRKLRPIEAHDIGCMIGEIVMVGGVRRAALISISDLDDEEMRHAKDWSRGEFPQIRYMANNSAYYDERPDEETFWAEWGALQASMSGERGLSIDSWHRRADRPKGQVRTNPCLTGGTRVMTQNGMVKIEDLVHVDTKEGSGGYKVAIDRRFNEGVWAAADTSSGVAFKSGTKEVFTLKTQEGYRLRLTADHRVMTVDGWREAGQLQPGDRIHIANTEGMFGHRGNADVGMLGGWITGDGALLAEDNNSPRLYFYGDDQHLIPMMLDAVERLTGQRPNVPHREENDRKHFECAALREYLGQIIANKFRVPEFVWQGTEDCQRSYLSALFSADGGVQGTRDKGVSVRLASSKLDLLHDVQMLLLNFGIASKVYEERRPSGYRDLPDGRGGYKTYFCEADHELMISKGNLVRFHERIGFIHDEKQATLTEEIEDRLALVGVKGASGRKGRGFYRESFTARFESLTLDGTEDVFDMTVPVTHSLVANGVVVHNCGEIGLRFQHASDPVTGEHGSGQFCVAGDTPLVTRQGLVEIKDAVGQPVEVWNGEQWSEVVPFQTGIGQKLYRVTFSDGSHLDTTAYHRFSVSNRNTRRTKTPWREMTVADLMESGLHKRWATEPFEIRQDDGEHIDLGHAYTAGAAVGDGWIRKDRNTVYTGLWGKKDAAMPVVGVRGTPHVANATNLALKMTTVFCPDQDPHFITALKTDAEALNELFLWSRESILHLLAGWLDADGSQMGEGGVRLYLSDETRARKVQLLLTRCGIRSTIRLLAEAGTETNLGVRKRDLWYVDITDCADIPCHRLDTSRGHKPRFKSKFQTIRSIEELPGLHHTFCFEESERHMGVFGNTLTYQCNLSAAVMRSHDTVETFEEKVRIATWIGIIQSTFTHFPYLRPGWEQVCKEDQLLGVDITGQCDNPELTFDPEIMSHFNKVAVKTAAEAAAIMDINMPVAITCGKPSGNSSQLLDCASGFHPRYSRYYLRRVRIASTDPLFHLARDTGLPVYKEVQFRDWDDDEVPTWVVEFPVKAPEGAVLRDDERALDQCNRYLNIMKSWCSNRGHNQSATIYVREDEWEDVGRWVYENFEDITGLSFLPYDAGKYELAPYEEITKEQYEAAKAAMPDVDFSLLSVYEQEDRGQGSVELACVGGSCEIDYDALVEKEEGSDVGFLNVEPGEAK